MVSLFKRIDDDVTIAICIRSDMSKIVIQANSLHVFDSVLKLSVRHRRTPITLWKLNHQTEQFCGVMSDKLIMMV